MSNLIVNGDFEASNTILVGWNTSPLVPIKTSVGVGEGIGGSNAATLFAASTFPFPDPDPPTISQNLPTIIGVTYEVRFFFSPKVIDSNARVTVNGDTIFDELFMSDSQFYERVTYFVATSTTSTVAFISDYGGNCDFDDISVFAVIICYSGDSIVHTKNVQSGHIEDIQVRDLIAGVHDVYDTTNNEFIPVVYNVVNGPTERYMCIKKDLLGDNKPSADFYVTSGHPILYNGVVTKAKNIPGAKRVKVKPEPVYSICVDTKDKVPILINNIDVMAWKKGQWEEIAERKKIAWTNNKL